MTAVKLHEKWEEKNSEKYITFKRLYKYEKKKSTLVFEVFFNPELLKEKKKKSSK